MFFLTAAELLDRRGKFARQCHGQSRLVADIVKRPRSVQALADAGLLGESAFEGASEGASEMHSSSSAISAVASDRRIGVNQT